MDNLTIIIKGNSEEKIYNYIKMLSPLLGDGKTQLILINNINNKFNINYEYIVYEFEEEYEKFYEFCEASSVNNRIMIIEEGIVLNEEAIREIEELLLKYENINIKADLKKYYNNDIYYIEEKTLIYNNKSLDKDKIDAKIEDFTYLNNYGVNLKHNISRFVLSRRFDELYLWYKNSIIKDETTKLKFYSYIEKYKANLNYSTRELIEKYFLLEELDFKYCQYLKLMKMLKENQLSESYLKSIMEKSDYSERDLYFSNIILECFRVKRMVNEILITISQDKIEVFIKYLFDESDDFQEYIYEFIVSTDIEAEFNIGNHENILAYMNLIEIYYRNIGTSFVDKDMKEKLIGLLIYYSSCGSYVLKHNLISDSEKKNGLLKLEEVQSLVKLGEIKKASDILFELAEAWEVIMLPVRYYAQKIIYENRIYSNVFSITMIVKNEEKNLERCLKSLVPLLNNNMAELIVVDTGSTDKTVDIAKKYTDKVYFHQWQGNFSEARNWSMSLARGEYIFIIDADNEYDKSEIEKYINYFSSKEYRIYNSFSFKVKNYEDENNVKFSILAQNHIFKNDGSFYYYGTVHNQPNFKGPVKDLDIMVHHYGYIMDSREARERKFNRTGYILKKELEKDPLNIYYRYQLMKSYSVYGDYKESLNQANLLLKLLENKTNKSDYIIYFNASMIVKFCNRLYDETIKLCNIILDILPNFIDALYFKAQSLFLQKKYCESIKYYKYYLNELDTIYDNPIINDIRLELYSIDSKELAEADVMISYLQLQEYLEFIEYVLTKDKNQVVKYQFGIIKSYTNLNKFKELAMFYEEYLNTATENDKFEFNYYIKNEIENLDNTKLKALLSEFNKFNLTDKYLNLLTKSIERREKNSLRDIIRFLTEKDMQNISIMILEKSIYDFIIILINSKETGLTLSEIVKMRKIIKSVLIQILNKKSIEGLNQEQILSIIFKYMDYSFLVYENNKQSLQQKEVLFLEKILLAFQHIQNKDLLSAVREIKNASLEDEDMANAMAIYVQSITRM